MSVKRVLIIIICLVLTACVPIHIKNSARDKKGSILYGLPDVMIVCGNIYTIIDRRDRKYSDTRQLIERYVRCYFVQYNRNFSEISREINSKLKCDHLAPLKKRIEVVLVGGNEFVCFADMLNPKKQYGGTIYISGEYGSYLLVKNKELLISLIAHEVAHIILGDEGDIVKGPVAIACMAATVTGIGAVAMLPLILVPPRVMGEDVERIVENRADLIASILVTYCGFSRSTYKEALCQLLDMIPTKEQAAREEIQRRISFVSENS